MLKIVVRQGVYSQSLINLPDKNKDTLGKIMSLELLFKEVIVLLEEITRFSEFKPEVIEALREESEFLKHLSSLQYTI